ncbi:hypothetical protein Ssi03_68650 [Sphaerisporangium siamense]|uniref:Polymerase nucleotidyl transferase domain-containing protein n=1 Tax=Sphaerisporangium siamense TaxID=795645 RepID=A0A7W7D743_9ACTN|nr:nucleotidyltransferase domain-containing protein [Sphaerisporangium siamense]MBB4700595.1 hypothetical protein [Sphaerisporangium siamense]GII88875.1 hypothetical protein Ssi03_68650 [Sphaerisporangium siamense]
MATAPPAPGEGWALSDEVEHLIRWAAKVAEEEFTGAGGVDSVYLGGSLLAGLGSPTSDIDVFVVRQGVTGDEVPAQVVSDSRRFDVESLPPGHLLRLARDVTAFPRAAYTNLEVVHLSESRYDAAVRLLYSRPVAEGSEYREAVAHLRENFVSLTRMVMAKWSTECINILEDALGAVAGESYDDALFSSAELMQPAAQVFLAGCGDLYVKYKWILRKLRRSAGENFPYDRFCRLMGAWPDDVADKKRLVEDRIRLCQAMAVAGLTDGWDGPAASRWSTWDVHGPGLVRSPEWMPLRAADRIVLAKSIDSVYRLSEQGLTLWGLCDGREYPVVVDDMVRRLGDPGLRPDVERYLDRFLQMGLVRAGAGD